MCLRSAELKEGMLLRANLFARGVLGVETGVKGMIEHTEVSGDCRGEKICYISTIYKILVQCVHTSASTGTSIGSFSSPPIT